MYTWKTTLEKMKLQYWGGKKNPFFKLIHPYLTHLKEEIPNPLSVKSNILTDYPVLTSSGPRLLFK